MARSTGNTAVCWISTGEVKNWAAALIDPQGVSVCRRVEPVDVEMISRWTGARNLIYSLNNTDCALTQTESHFFLVIFLFMLPRVVFGSSWRLLLMDGGP